MSDVIRELFANIKVEDVPTEKNHVIEIASTETIEEAFSKLVDNYVLSAPVFDVATQQYVGFLDMKDLVSVVVFVADRKEEDHDHIRHLLKNLTTYRYPTDGLTVTYLARRHPFHPVKLGSPLLKACEFLERRIHRVPLVNDAGKVVKILSQSAVVKLLQTKLAGLGAAAQKTVTELQLGNKNVMKVTGDTPALEAFRLMESKNLSGLGVVDKNGRLIGNVSSRDVKEFIVTAPAVSSLQMPVAQFLQKLRQEQIISDVHPTISCFGNSSFLYAVSKVVATRLHHLYVVDSEATFRPVGVFSLTDIIYAALHKL